MKIAGKAVDINNGFKYKTESKKECPFCGINSQWLEYRYGEHGWFGLLKCSVCGSQTRCIGVDVEQYYKEVHDGEIPTVELQLEELWNMRGGKPYGRAQDVCKNDN